MNIAHRFALLLLASCCMAAPAFSQVEVAAGIDMVYPVLLNKYNSKLNYQQFGGGGHLGIIYKPEGTQFFPTLNLSLGATRLPLQEFGNNVACTHISYSSAMLNGNIVGTLRNDNTIYFLLGIGVSHINPTFLSISGPRGDAMKIRLDSSKNLLKYFPAAGAGIEYVYGNSVNTSLYISMGLYCQYVLLLEGRNEYNISVRDLKGNNLSYQTSLTGSLFQPSFYLSLHYLLGNELIFWKHK